ncbi:MAG: protein translocase subunit SecF [Alphaproteobacteria bacterium]
MRRLRLIKDGTHIDFMRMHKLCFAFSAFFILGAIGLSLVKGLNYGIDFRGGILIEMRMEQTPDFGALRVKLGALELGDVTLQKFGEDRDVLVRIELQQDGERGNQRALQAIREAMGEGTVFRRVETVGPTVGEELRTAGLYAVLASVAAILIYVWFRFEWQFGIGAVVALTHDVVAIIGLFALLGLDFDLSTLAAILTIGGYSINDTVVVYDRIRENLRKYKRMELRELLNKSVNDTLSRTVMTSITVMLAIAAMFVFAGPVIRNFNLAMLVGVVVGTYSSIFVAAPLLVYLKLKRGAFDAEAKHAAEQAKP